ncbi:Asc-type amino acid transporter 1 [Labeo rohita]|uniref:Asc-type amino acid transporter 1 n=1 Tax=Labeo rohita TaxID=84645 RepID=A0A498LM95_LABRO|nr:Asc-type amino acid transporter 1 [Labeo rohita]RXN37752.1 Asc-type amino acid transporter 1 [Labeo rohita]
MFATQATCGSHTNIDSYTSSVLDHINTTIDSVTTQKQITIYPNQKPWMNKEVRILLKARNTAFRSGDLKLLKKIQTFQNTQNLVFIFKKNTCVIC